MIHSNSPARSLSDPPANSPLIEAVSWVEGALLGTLATTVCVIAIACVGLMMLSGRLGLRRGITVVLGCFLVFGAQSLVGGLQRLTTQSDGGAYRPPVVAAVIPPATPAPAAQPANPDPYAGAALPVR